jgi:type I restriction enzyme S subunit
MSVNSYPQYKATDIGWIREIPTNWLVLPLYSVAYECDESNLGMIESNLLSLSYGRIINKDINSNDGLLPESFETYQVVQPDDMVLRLTDLQNDKRSLRSAIVKNRGIITSAYLALRPHSIFPSYLNYLLRSYDLTKVFYSMGGGLRQSMKFSDIKRLPILIPSADEQKRIAEFLDQEIAKTDALMAEQKRMIDLLKEKRQAMISAAITKGLNPNAKTKESGVVWLGQIPEHWKVITFKWLIDRNDGGVWGDEPTGTNDTIVLRSTEQSVDGNWTIEDPAFRQLNDQEKLSATLVVGDLLITKSSGSALHIGKTTLVTEEVASMNCCYSNFTQRIRTRSNFNPKLAWYILNNRLSRIQFDHLSNSTTGLANLNQTMIGQIIVTLMPIEEQHSIIKYLDHETAKIDNLIAGQEKLIALSNERRQALITAATTGQIDVRIVATELEAA